MSFWEGIGPANKNRLFTHEQIEAFLLIKPGYLLTDLLTGCDERGELTQELRAALQFFDEVGYTNVR